MPTEKQAPKLLMKLQQAYPEARCGLEYANSWQLLVATILSAQCTDKRVNQVTRELFRQLPGPKEMSEASQLLVEELIRSTGFFRNKAKNIILCAGRVFIQYSGEVPATLKELVSFPGVGRKTANVVLGNVFGIPGMVVDTHVKRLSRRFGWTCSEKPEQIEKDLCHLLPEKDWTQAGHTLIAHGRACCKAPTPTCSNCPIVSVCPQVGVERSK